MTLKETKIGVVGGGVVGQATAESYREHVAEVRVYDVDPARKTHPLWDVLACDVVFVCLPTPQDWSGNGFGLDTGFVEEFFSSQAGSTTHFVLRSTVPVGTTRRLATTYSIPNLIHSPEFLTARTAVGDANNPRICAIGSLTKVSGKISLHEIPDVDRRYLGILYDRFAFKKNQLVGNEVVSTEWADIAYLTAEESEMVKLAMNAFFAVKVAFWNEISSVCQRLGVSYPEVIETIVGEGRVHPLHTQVPGPDGKYGFGGACLPKDLSEVVKMVTDDQSASGDVFGSVVRAAYARNVFDRQRDQS